MAALALTATAGALGLARGYAERVGVRPEDDSWLDAHGPDIATTAAVIAWIATAALAVVDTWCQGRLPKS